MKSKPNKLVTLADWKRDSQAVHKELEKQAQHIAELLEFLNMEKRDRQSAEKLMMKNAERAGMLQAIIIAMLVEKYRVEKTL